MDCAINSMDLPATGEANHQIGDCYCYLCDCGQHKCPSITTYRRGYPAKAYSSIYQNTYDKKAPTELLKYIRAGQLLPSSQKMNLETTQRNDYQKTSSDFNKRNQVESLSPASNSKFINSSSYQLNYPNWKYYYTLDYRLRNNYSGSPLKFSAKSTYGHDFREFVPQPAGKRTEFPIPSLIGCRTSETGKTTNQLVYRPHKIRVGHKRSTSNNDYVALESVGFSSTYRKDFLPHQKKGRMPTKKQTISSLGN